MEGCLLHIHNWQNEVYSLHGTVVGCMVELIRYVETYWGDDIHDMAHSVPITKEDIDHYMDVSEEWFNIVELDVENKVTRIIYPEEFWAIWQGSLPLED